MMLAGDFKPLVDYEKLGTGGDAFHSDAGSLPAAALCDWRPGNRAKTSHSRSKASMEDRSPCCRFVLVQGNGHESRDPDKLDKRDGLIPKKGVEIGKLNS